METAVVLILAVIGRVACLDKYMERGESESRLIHDLFDRNGYNPLIRPVVNASDTLDIAFNLALSQIINVDEVNQVMKTNVWLQVYWQDYQLKWDPLQYSNIGSIRIKPNRVWVPDFVLFNNADGNFEVTYKSNCVLYANSEVHWIPPAIYHSSCSIDVKYFPFDEQVCEMKFGSWTHKGRALKFHFYKNRDKLDLVDYLKSGSWDIVDCPGKIDIYDDELNNDQREQIVFKFVLRRKSLFYTVNLIIPCVLISFVTVCVFALPADAGEKMALCISLLLALVVFLLLVSKILPPSLNIPLIAKYLLFTFVMNLVAILYTVIIINWNYRTPRTHRLPYWVRVVFLRELPKYLLMTRPDHDRRWREKSPRLTCVQPSVTKTHGNLAFVSLEDTVPPELSQPQVDDNQDVRWRLTRGQSLAETRGGLDAPSCSQNSEERSIRVGVNPELRKTIDSVQFIYKHLKAEEEYETVREDWKYVARVLDRLLLVIFLLVTLAGTAGLLLNAPHILEFVDQDQIIRNLIQYIRQAEAGANS